MVGEYGLHLAVADKQYFYHLSHLPSFPFINLQTLDFPGFLASSILLLFSREPALFCISRTLEGVNPGVNRIGLHLRFFYYCFTVPETFPPGKGGRILSGASFFHGSSCDNNLSGPSLQLSCHSALKLEAFYLGRPPLRRIQNLCF